MAYEAMLRQRLARGEPVDREAAQQDQSFDQFAWGWFDDYVVTNNKFSERRAKKGILALHLVPFFGKLPLNKIGTHHVEQFKARQMKDGVSHKTLRNRLTVLSKCLSCAHEWLNLDAPLPKIQWPKCPPPKTDYLSPEECELLLSSADGVVYEMIFTALRTGMRQGELKGLQWSSIDWHNRSLAVRHSYCDVRKALDTPKSNRERHVPLDVDLFELLHSRKQSTGFVFMDGNKPFNSQRINLRLAKVCKAAGMRIVTWHLLRHTFASHLAMRGTPLHVVQALLGHSSITTTMRYAHVAPSILRTAIEMLNPRTATNADLGQPVGNHWMLAERRARKDAELSSGW
ncbi:integrase [Bradyrhizobium sp. USDA 3311]